MEVTFSNGFVVDDTGGPNGLDNNMHRQNLLPAFAAIVNEGDRAVSAADSAVNAPGTKATSVTSMTCGTGSKSFTLAETGKQFGVGQNVVIARTSAPETQMRGRITAFNSGTGAITVNAVFADNAGGPYTDWTISLAGVDGSAARGNGELRTSNTALAVADLGKHFRATGTFTQTLVAAATLGNGWFAWYKNDGSGIITIDPNSAETINGASTMLLYPGQAAHLWTDGSNIFAIVFNGPAYLFHSSTPNGLTEVAIDVPAGRKRLIVEFKGISNNTGNSNVRAYVGNAGSYSSAITISGTIGASSANTFNAVLVIDNYDSDIMQMYDEHVGHSAAADLTATSVELTKLFNRVRVDGGLKRIKFDWASGYQFDEGGTIKAWVV